MLSDLDIYRAAHLMLHQYGDNAELEAAQCFDRMLRRDDCDELLTWFRIWRTIAAMRQAPVSARALPRVQLPTDLVGSVVFFASPDSDFITGQTLVVDGGATMH